jgi:hypothetical protein
LLDSKAPNFRTFKLPLESFQNRNHSIIVIDLIQGIWQWHFTRNAVLIHVAEMFVLQTDWTVVNQSVCYKRISDLQKFH